MCGQVLAFEAVHRASGLDEGLGVSRVPEAPHRERSLVLVPASSLTRLTSEALTAAVRLGGEHLLWGLTAEDNGASRLLRAAGVSPDTVHRSVGSRLSMGASQAAQRIAWTPHSRKAIDIAEARSRQNGSDRIGCDDLLIGLARVGRGVAADVLTQAGFDPAALGPTSVDA
ncbi:Clp protease N-terminal domain-containing protein [Streptomyces tanashiensis]|uniref:Clp protease N-terminal domain-containing protein n=1 Tax=Streptomyces tanashiensis TaxID=67367 RepID=UPI0033D8FF5A